MKSRQTEDLESHMQQQLAVYGRVCAVCLVDKKKGSDQLALGAAFGPLSAGAVYDHFNSYAPFIAGIIVAMAISALVLLTLKCPPEPETLGEAG